MINTVDKHSDFSVIPRNKGSVQFMNPCQMVNSKVEIIDVIV